MMISNLLRPFWARLFKPAWVLSVILFILLGGLRAYGLFGPATARMWIMVTFIIMWFLPAIFFSKTGRQAIGLKKVERPLWLLWGPLLGAAAAVLVYAIGYWLYGRTSENWYITILHSWEIDGQMMQLPRTALFAIYTLPAMLLSPIGEEFFFRGILHETVRERWNAPAATFANCLAFGLVHLLHHGIQPGQGLFVSGLLWVLLMSGSSWVFTLCRQRGGSIWPAVLSHAAFNLAMNITIFWFLF